MAEQMFMSHLVTKDEAAEALRRRLRELVCELAVMTPRRPGRATFRTGAFD